MRETMNLETIKSKYEASAEKVRKRVIICAGTGCMANGSKAVYEEFVRQLEEHGEKALVVLDKHEEGYQVSGSGCQGFCQMGPLVSVLPAGLMYCKVKRGDVAEIVRESVLGEGCVERLAYRCPDSGCICDRMEDIPFYSRQDRLVLKKCGFLDPEDLAEYVARGGYFAARRAALEMKPEEICATILESGLRGRGGGGFPTGRKWEMARIQDSRKKYIVCNGDEGDPGAFMDRSVMEGNPHSVLEGMIIAALGIGADEGYIYVRAEYPLAVARMKRAVRDAAEAGILGDNLFGTGRQMTMHVVEGAGAFVCGEETALLSSIEGNRGMPNPKPPFPAQKGLFGCPTIINNVETLATIPLIMEMGAEKYRELGVPSSPGTKTFALTGHVANTGLIEVPLGTTLRHIIKDIAGGVTDDHGELCGTDFKAVQIGGPSGGCLVQEHLDLPLDFDSLKRAGAMVGSGGLVVMNKSTCMVEIARFFMQFTQNESCGKCVPCREGTKQMLALLTDIVEGRATLETLSLLEELARMVQIGSLCALGKTAPNPVLSTLRYFREEYLAHVVDKRCPAGKCAALRVYSIDVEKCIGCGACKRKCPVGAIEGSPKGPHRIDPDKCIKCGACVKTCKFGAISA